jgi:hypothetical protein
MCLNQDWNLLILCENWSNIVSLCIIDSSQYKDSLMRLETCMIDIGLPLLQWFHVKQGDIYDNNYYP